MSEKEELEYYQEICNRKPKGFLIQTREQYLWGFTKWRLKTDV